MNSSWAHVTYTTNDQHSSSSCKGTSGLLHVMGVKHSGLVFVCFCIFSELGSACDEVSFPAYFC